MASTEAIPRVRGRIAKKLLHMWAGVPQWDKMAALVTVLYLPTTSVTPQHALAAQVVAVLPNAMIKPARISRPRMTGYLD